MDVATAYLSIGTNFIASVHTHSSINCALMAVSLYIFFLFLFGCTERHEGS